MRFIDSQPNIIPADKIHPAFGVQTGKGGRRLVSAQNNNIYSIGNGFNTSVDDGLKRRIFRNILIIVENNDRIPGFIN